MTLDHDLGIDLMLQSYVETALWSTNDESDPRGGNPLDDNYTHDDVDPESLKQMRADVERFATENHEDISTWKWEYTSEEMAGHDFWLTRNGHGAGFWDGDWDKDVGERLSDAARAFGECHLYVDNGVVYLY